MCDPPPAAVTRYYNFIFKIWIQKIPQLDRVTDEIARGGIVDVKDERRVMADRFIKPVVLCKRLENIKHQRIKL